MSDIEDFYESDYENDDLYDLSESEYDNDISEDLYDPDYDNDVDVNISILVDSNDDTISLGETESADSVTPDSGKSCKIKKNDTPNNILSKICKSIDPDENESRKKIPKVIEINKMKLLIAINEIRNKELSKEDEELMKSFTSKMLMKMLTMHKLFKPQSQVWDDSKTKQKIKEILIKHAKFELFKYLECTKIVFLAYSGKMEKHLKVVTDAMEYVLTHARLFGDTTKPIFQTGEIIVEKEPKMELKSDKLQLALPSNKLLDKIGQIIRELIETYDETKFIILNVNTTYFTLLMLRRIVKNEKEFYKAFKNIHTHDNYVKLCPMPLDNQLPKCEFKICERNLLNCAYLAIEIYMNTNDEKTKRILRATSILHMEWNGLQLPQLFFKAVSLYKVKPGDLFDLLFQRDCEYPVLSSCFNFAGDYYTLYEKSKTGVTTRWFPFCRVLDGTYHVYLSAKNNVEVCSVLACLVDLKIGFDKSTIRMSHWVKSADKCMLSAKILYEKLNKNV